MSQAGILDVINSNPEIPIDFVADSGTAIAINNEIEILGGVGIDTSASGNTITISLTGGGSGIDSIGTQTGTNPVTPDINGLVTINGAVVPAGTNPIRSDGTGPNTLAIEVQKSQAIGSTDATKIGLAAFDSASFTVDSNGFVSLAGAAFTWTDVSGAFGAARNNGYFITGTATANLPASPSQGDTIQFFVDHASQVLTIDAPGTQIIRMGNIVTASGGTAISTLRGDSVELVYRASDTCWCAVDYIGTWLVT